MKLTKLHLIIILGLVIILCPVFGVCSNAREGFEQEDEITEEGMELTGGKDKKVKEYMPSGGYNEPNFGSGEPRDSFETSDSRDLLDGPEINYN
jgi:hypothetical protein